VPRHISVDALDLGAKYRYAEIDPVRVQPIACLFFDSVLNMLSEQLPGQTFLGNKKELLRKMITMDKLNPIVEFESNVSWRHRGHDSPSPTNLYATRKSRPSSRMSLCRSPGTFTLFVFTPILFFPRSSGLMKKQED